MNARRPLWLALAPALFLGLWSAGYAIAKIALLYAEPMTLLVLRFGFVVAAMIVFFAIFRPPLPATKAEWGHLAIVGFLIQAVYFGMCYLAFRTGVAAGTLALFMSLQPILVAIVMPRWTGGSIGWRRWIGPPSLYGFLFTAMALAGITGGTLWEKRFGLNHHPITANLIGYSAGLIVIVPAMLGLETMQVNWTWSFSAALAYLVIGNSVIAVGLLLAMIRAGDVSRVSALFFLVPPLAALLAWFLLGEIMPPTAWAGMALAAVGVFLATRETAT